MERIYLDHAATSPMDERVLEEMKPHFFGSFGNPSSIHSFGRESRKWVDEARADIAREISAKEQEIIFTSGGTEADNLAIFGTAPPGRMKESISLRPLLSIMLCCTPAKSWKKTALR